MIYVMETFHEIVEYTRCERKSRRFEELATFLKLRF